MSKPLVADSALKGPFAIVKATVDRQIAAVSEACAAVVAGERLLASVNAIMGHQGVPVREPRSTVVASMGLVAGVDETMPIQMRLRLALHSAVRTSECPASADLGCR